MILTTSNNIEGYEIEKYLGLVSGTDIYLVGGFSGGGLYEQNGLFILARKKAEKTLMKEAAGLNADAVISIQQSYTSPGAANYMVLALTGTAVKLQQNEAKKLQLEELKAKEEDRKIKTAEDCIREERMKAEQEEVEWEAAVLHSKFTYHDHITAIEELDSAKGIFNYLIENGFETDSLVSKMLVNINDFVRKEKRFGINHKEDAIKVIKKSCGILE